MKHIHKLFFGFAAALTTLSAGAVPAVLGVRPYTQPDGSVINIQKIGDGYMHFTLTEDGRLLTQDADGFYRFAEIDNKGRLVSTGILASENLNKPVGRQLTDYDIQSLMIQREADGVSTTSAGYGLMSNTYPTTGSPVVPVILVEYTDVKFQPGYDVKAYFEAALNSPSFNENGAPGSVSSYFKEMSKGRFTPKFDVYGPVTLPNNQAYYGADAGFTTDAFSHYMVSHAAKILDPEVDFSKYDLDKDGDVDFVYIIYAGKGQHRDGDNNTVWPHAGNLRGDANFTQVDGKWLNKYACSNEYAKDRLEGFGNLLHEYSHIIGLPDLYTTDPYTFHYWTPGMYSILDYGVYNNDGFTPCGYTAFERNALKWDQPKVVIDGPMQVELKANEYAVVHTSKKTEFFILENRQQVGWDAYLPNHGLVIWHIDYTSGTFSNNEVNVDKNHQRVDLIEANNTPSFEKGGKLWLENMEGWTFPGASNVTSFTAQTQPAFLTWGNEDLGLPITNIREEDGVVYFNVAMEEPEPEQPGDDDDPTTPDNPGDDDDPTTPDNPGDDDDPTTPDNPGDDDDPTTPDQPGNDDDPTTPDQPGDDDPSTPDNPGDNGEDEEPGDIETGVGTIQATNLYQVYTLQGMKVTTTTDLSTLKSGLYIINGKKVVIR